MKKILIFFLSLLLLMAVAVPCLAKTDTVQKEAVPVSSATADMTKQDILQGNLPENLGETSLLDMENLLQPAEQKELLQKLAGIEQKYNIRIVVMTVPDDGRTGTESGIKRFADKVLNRYYRDEKNNNGSIMLVVCPQARKWAVTTDNNMRRYITDANGYPSLKESFLEQLKDNDYNGAFNAYADRVEELIAYYNEEGIPWDPADEFSYTGAVLAVIMSALIGYGFVGYLRSRMSNVQPASEADDYLDQNSIDITRENDVFLYTTRTVTKRVKSESSSSSGRSSNGGGSGSY